MNACSISVIIPAYNVDQYIHAALTSIKEQTELPDEVIVIDDGSTDNTLEIVKGFEFFCDYKVLSIANQGQGNARNMGVEIATSEYVYFFDSDDLLKPHFIKTIKHEIYKNNNPDIVLFSGESFNDAEYQGNRWIDYNRGFSGSFNSHIKFLDQAVAHNAMFCQPCLYISKKILWGSAGLAFRSNFLEDEAVFLPLIFKCNTFVVVNEVFFLRRNREGSTMTMKKNIKHAKGALNCLQETVSLYKLPALLPNERKHIANRLSSHCGAYIANSRSPGCRIKIKEIINAVMVSRSPKVAIKSLLYFMGVDKLLAYVRQLKS